LPPDPPPLDRHECYELCVQSPRHVVSLLEAIHANQPRILHEDFSGTAAVSRRWSATPGHRAVAVDLDAEILARAQDFARRDNVVEQITFVQQDILTNNPEAGTRSTPTTTKPSVLSPTRVPTPAPAPDIIFVGNFSIGYIHRRADLVRYLRHCRARLAQGNAGFGGGIFACDTYGGSSAFTLGALERRHPSRNREIIRYCWQHEAADPLTSMVTNSISFRIELDGEIIHELPRAFVYHWRLWSIAELREAMHEAGFTSTAVYSDLNIAPGQPATPITDPTDLNQDWIVLITARD
jgi:hypothetical protein